MRNYKLIYTNHAKGIFSRYSHGIFRSSYFHNFSYFVEYL